MNGRERNVFKRGKRESNYYREGRESERERCVLKRRNGERKEREGYGN